MPTNDDDREARALAGSWHPGGDAGAAPPQPGASTMAILSLVLGLASPFTCGVSSLVAIPLGVVALLRIRRSGGALGGRSAALTGIVVSAVALLCAVGVGLGLVLPAALKARHEGARAGCVNNLRQIGLTIGVHLQGPQGRMPDGLEQMLPNYIADRRILVCPCDGHPMTLPGGVQCSYHYVGRLSQLTNTSVVIAYENAGNHGEKRNVLLLDARVESLAQREFCQKLNESIEKVKMQWDEYTPERRKAIEDFYRDGCVP